jgi:dihydroflavonol-4-reductase
VKVLVRAASDKSAIQRVPVEIAVGDVLDVRSLDLAARGCDAVFHAAAHFAYWGKSPAELESTAVRGTANVLHAAARAASSRVIVTSSSVVFGYSDTPVARDELSVPKQEKHAPYVSAKIKQDRSALRLAERLGIDIVLVCPTLVVGPFAPSLGPSNAVITSYLEDAFRFTFPGGCNIVAASDVGDGHLIAAMRARPGERYLLGGQNLEWREVHSLISVLCGTYGPLHTATHSLSYLAAFGEELRARFAERPPLSTRTQATMLGRFYWYDHRKLDDLGFRPRTAEAAVATALSWLVASPHLSREARSRIRLTEPVWAARRDLRAREEKLREIA